MSRPEYVWKFDINRRVYASKSMGPPIWREHWGQHKIVGETRVSYLLEFGGKVSKKPDDRTHVFDAGYLDELVWANENRHRLARAVSWQGAGVLPPAALREVAAIVDRYA